MRFVDEYREPARVKAVAEAIAARVTRPHVLMEICGGQTHAILRYGLDQLLPSQVRLVHGPGCPVCVTSVALIDQAVAIARNPEVILTSYGDMLRVPGSSADLLTARSEGADVRMVYSPLDAVRLAQENPERQVVFFAVGFETTAPANGMSVKMAKQLGLKNFSLLSSHVLVPPAIDAILSDPTNVVQGFLAAGHVCAVMGLAEYESLAQKHHTPMVVTGFEPLDLLQGIYLAVDALEAGAATVVNQYARVVAPEGNPVARAVLKEVFEVCDREWRGIGLIPASGFSLSLSYREFDAARRFAVEHLVSRESKLCRAGEVLRGLLEPKACGAFGTACSPEHPLGAPMVSSEGACAAYYRYMR